jgi:outer membrane protein assembly factor BamB
MTPPNTDPSRAPSFKDSHKPLRLWPGVVAVVLQWLGWLVVPALFPSIGIFGLLGLPLGALAITIWWLFFSRAAWIERIGALILFGVAPFLTKLIVHPSISNGAQGYLIYLLAMPVMSLALVAWAVATRRLAIGRRRAALVVAVVIASATLLLIRTGGISGDGQSDLHFRWTKTPEERLLAQAANEPLASTAAAPAIAQTDGEWPGFRGANRDGIVHGVRINTDWNAAPPVQLWRRPVGPGWSSFAVQAGRFYTQEQRGEDEVVGCYDVNTGQPIWRHNDRARFWESNGGAGPRATPTLSKGRVYSLGATGIVNVLDAGTGSIIWSRNAVADTGAKIPGWGISGSPLVVNDVVIVAAAGSLAAYDLATGTPRWYGPRGGSSYSSPQLLTVDGVAQVLLLHATGATSLALSDGKLLWEHAWPGTPIVQPAFADNGDILMAVSDSSGTRRLGITHAAGNWTTEERWTSEDLNPFFNDFVINKGYAFGFDGNVLACINLQDGKRAWKGGRYGNGQLVLLGDQDVLLVLSEKGELVLVKAAADQFTELARFPALEGKTWNHPVLIGDVLLVRNDHEMAAFRLAALKQTVSLRLISPTEDAN